MRSQACHVPADGSTGADRQGGYNQLKRYGLKPDRHRAESESVTAAHVTWRPLGALLVEKGLLTAEELEEALAAQQTTGKRLGQILVDRGHVSGPALTNALAEQYGIELKTEEGFGTGLRAEIERRHSTRRPPVAAEDDPAGSLPGTPHEAGPNGGEGGIEQIFEHLAGDVPLAELEPQLEEHWARLAAAEANVTAREARIAELESELGALNRRLQESQSSAGAVDEVERSLAAARREADERARRLEEVTAERDEARRSLEISRARAAELEQAAESAAAQTRDEAKRQVELRRTAGTDHGGGEIGQDLGADRILGLDGAPELCQ